MQHRRRGQPATATPQHYCNAAAPCPALAEAAAIPACGRHQDRLHQRHSMQLSMQAQQSQTSLGQFWGRTTRQAASRSSTAKGKRRSHSAAPTATPHGQLAAGTGTRPCGRSCAGHAGTLPKDTLGSCLTKACWRGVSGCGECRHASAHGSAQSVARQSAAAAGSMQEVSGTGTQQILPSGCARPVV
jgi:hypothetical protein